MMAWRGNSRCEVSPQTLDVGPRQLPSIETSLAQNVHPQFELSWLGFLRSTPIGMAADTAAVTVHSCQDLVFLDDPCSRFWLWLRLNKFSIDISRIRIQFYRNTEQIR